MWFLPQVRCNSVLVLSNLSCLATHLAPSKHCSNNTDWGSLQQTEPPGNRKQSSVKDNILLHCIALSKHSKLDQPRFIKGDWSHLLFFQSLPTSLSWQVCPFIGHSGTLWDTPTSFLQCTMFFGSTQSRRYPSLEII